MPFRTRALAGAAAIAALVPAGTAAALPLDTPVEIASGLRTPWAVEDLWQDRVFVTERSSRATNVNASAPAIRVLNRTGGVAPEPVFVDTSPGVVARKFLGLALHPQFRTNGLAYLYETYTQAGATHSRVLRLRDDCTRFTLDRVIFDGIDSDLNHDGGRIAFGPDGKLYVTTGDIHDPDRPRDVTNLNGKILRLSAPGDDSDGTAPADNPFAGGTGAAPFVWSLGHRHPQGLAWDAAGQLWETEHGPSGEGHAPAGATDGRDELNLIKRGADYGWPAVAGDQTLAGTEPPKWHSGPAPAAAPGGLAYGADGILYMPMLNGTGLRTFTVAGETATAGAELYDGTYGRMRAATASYDGFLWLTTDNGRVLRVRIANPILPAVAYPPCSRAPFVPTPPDGPTTPTTPAPPSAPFAPAPTPTTPPGTGTGSDAADRQARAALAARLQARARTALTGLSLRGLLRRGAFTVRVGGLGTNRAVVRLRRGSTTVARGTAAGGSRKAVVVRVRLTTQGRRLLRAQARVRLTLRTDVIARGAAAGTVRQASVTLRR